MKKYLLSILFAFITLTVSYAQGADCATADPFCTGSSTTFPASTTTTAPIGPNYGCLGSQPNPAFYYLQINSAGTLVLDIASSAGVDIDFICWGPFATNAAACASGLTGSAVDCSYSASATETCTIPSALPGEVYVLLITNFSGVATNISFVDNPSSGSTATTDCSILCSMTALTAVPTACDSTTILYDVSGTITYSTPPTTGTLVVTNTCTGATQTFNPPFPPTSQTYTFTGLPSNGASCGVTAFFTADTSCTFTTTYSAPPPCTVICNISGISTTTTPCDVLTNSYDVSGNVTFINQPTTGTLNITNSCGGVPLTINPPFVSPIPYGFTGLTSNGLPCTITATFSTDPTCTFTQTYTAPAACTTCPVTATNNGPLCEGDSLHLFATTVVGATYSWTGPGGFTSTLQNPTVFAGAGSGGAYSVTVNIVAPPCNSSSTTTFVLNPKPTISTSATQSIYGGSSALIYASGGTTYAWIPSTNLTCSTCDSTFASPQTTTDYCVAVGDAGCFDTACVKVKVVIPCPSNRTMQVPNAFTPNGDGNNDELCLSGWDDCISSFEIMIYDRWGEKLFSSTQPDFCWDGIYHGKLLNSDVYVYFIKASYLAEGATPTAPKTEFTASKQGNITLIR